MEVPPLYTFQDSIIPAFDELLGYAAIIVGSVGALLQLWKTHRSENTESFSPVYLICAGLAELLLATQGWWKNSKTIVIMRIASFLYFIYFFGMWIKNSMDDSSSKKHKHDKKHNA